MTAPAGRKVTEVAVGVVVRTDGAVLLADRPAGKPYPGYWEFPGGKIEPGESIAAALVRELHEELGISVATSTPWVTFEFDYPHAYVRLHFERVHNWSGSPHPREGQRMGFYSPAATLPTPLLPAAVPALRWLLLPDVLELSKRSWRGGTVLGVDELRATQARPRGEWVGTFVENRADLERAARLACDFALVGPIFRDSGWSGSQALGWPGLAEVARGTPLPVFAFGGITASDLELARQHGAHGIAQSASAV